MRLAGKSGRYRVARRCQAYYCTAVQLHKGLHIKMSRGVSFDLVSFDSSDFVRAVNEEDFPDNASVFATRLPIGKADHFPLDGNAVAFPAFPAIDLEPGKSL
jgi:hypothetical protein